MTQGKIIIDNGRLSRILLVLISLNIIIFLTMLRYSGLKGVNQSTKQNNSQSQLLEEVNPKNGIEINARYADLGPKMLAQGVIDIDKFKEIYNQSRQPLTQEQLDILTKGSSKKIRITRDNAYFLLNFFWAVGLINKSQILDSGDMKKYGSPANYASTGGWNLGKTDSMNYYSHDPLIPLTSAQNELVTNVASHIYRPCCDNPTSFPDCNHGMALLGVLELMASQGASEKQMYQAAKYMNAYWFPANYFDLAQYFKAKDGQNFSQIDGKVILSKTYSSATGYTGIKKWLVDQGLVKQPPQQGGSCGV